MLPLYTAQAATKENNMKKSLSRNATIQELIEEVAQMKLGDRLVVRGLGNFRVIPTKPRTIVDVQTKKPVTLPASTSLRFTPSVALGDAVRENG